MSIRLFAVAVLALVFGLCVTAEAQTVQPVYTRPSKGASLVVLDATFPASGAAQTSAVYDMTAFAEVQFASRVTFSDASVSDEAFGISGFGRYIKIQASYDYTGPTTSIVYALLGSDSATGVFTEIGGVGGRQLVMPNRGTNIASAKLTMTPLPYSTIQYTRPGKGLPLVVYNRQSSGVGITNTPPIDMRGFASLSITANFSLPAGATLTYCQYAMNVIVWGGDSADQATMRILTSPNSSRQMVEDSAYAVDVLPNYIFVGGTAVNLGSGEDCNIKITVTPLPYNAPVGVSKITQSKVATLNLDAAGTAMNIPFDDRSQTTRIQVIGTGNVQCGESGIYPIELSGESSAFKGDGGVFVLNNFVGQPSSPFNCKTSGGVASALGVFRY